MNNEKENELFVKNEVRDDNGLDKVNGGYTSPFPNGIFHLCKYCGQELINGKCFTSWCSKKCFGTLIR